MPRSLPRTPAIVAGAAIAAMIALACAFAYAPAKAFAMSGGSDALAAGAVAVNTQAKEIESGNWRYVALKDGTAKIVQYIGKKTTVSIPSKIDGRKVTAIGDGYMDGQVFGPYEDADGNYVEGAQVKSITIPATVKTIGRVEKEDTISDMGAVIKYGKKRFYAIAGDSLQVVKVSKKNPYFSAKAGVLFDKKGTTLCYYPPARKGASYALPAKVKTIAAGAFQSAQNLKTITMSKALRTIEPMAFSYSNLRKVVFKPGIKTIGNYAFYGAERLGAIAFSKTITKIGNCAFAYTGAKKSLKFNVGLKEIGSQAFYLNEKMKVHTFTIPKTVKKIGDGAFDNFDVDNNWNPRATFKIPKKTKIVKDNWGICAKKIIRY